MKSLLHLTFAVTLLVACQFSAAFAQVPGHLNTAFADPAVITDTDVTALAAQPDGKVVVGGHFTSVGGQTRNHVARINVDGTVDTSFDPGMGADSYLTDLALQSDGKVLICGQFANFDGKPRNSIARLNADGSLDTTFDPGTGTDAAVHTLALQSDGGVVIGGIFMMVDGINRNHIARLHSDGTFDSTFDPGAGASDFVEKVAVQSDGKVVLVGDFLMFDNVTRNHIARTAATGALDTSFDSGDGADASILTVAIQSDGNIIVGGEFSKFGGAPYAFLARVKGTDGAVDGDFNVGAGPDNIVRAIAIRDDGEIAIGGDFFSYDNTGRDHVACLNLDGSLDVNFDSNIGTSGMMVESASFSPTGDLFIGGAFTTYGGVSQQGVALLNGTLPLVIAPPPPGAPTITVTTSADPEAFEGGAAGKFFLSRDTVDPTNDLTVYFKLRGAAVNGTDYQMLATTAVIPAGKTKIKLKVKAIDDAIVNGTRTVKLKLSASPSSSYFVGSPKKAVISIIDND